MAYSDPRAQKVAAESREAPPKTYELRQRSVRTSNSDLQAEARVYLRDFYTNTEGQMVCQICECEMPFKLDNGEYYFETILLLRDFPLELKQNTLALCPTCAAKYRFANRAPDSSLEKAVLCTEELTLSIELAREPHTIRFHRFHLNDLKSALRTHSHRH